MAVSRMRSSWRICRRYKFFFYFCILILCIQLFLGYSFYSMNQLELDKIHTWKSHIDQKLESVQMLPALNTSKVDQARFNHGIKDEPWNHTPKALKKTPEIQKVTEAPHQEDCSLINAKEAQSALRRAQTGECKRQLKNVACRSQKKLLYPSVLPRFCSLKSIHKEGQYLGCYADSQKQRDLSGFNYAFTADNSPQKCITFCLTGSYQYAGVQYKTECWCGNTYGKYEALPESSCKTVCPGNGSQTCGGYNAQRVFSTGLPAKKSNTAELVYKTDSIRSLTPVRIVFVLTVNGRAVRQVQRLVKTLYDPKHYFFIHVDKRSAYMYRELLKLESFMPNVRLARDRFATIWGGSSLLQAHFSFMKALLNMTDWAWDYYVNLSESDYPLKNVDQLTLFFTKYKGNNFLKSNGRETPTFMKKQGIDQTFYECENHLWRLGIRDIPRGIRFDGGSDWLALYRDFCDYSINSKDLLLTGLSQFYEYSLLPVESFFHTLLVNSAFCNQWVDNNLHLTNWKRKQGCKCQHKNQVDWCGCSPNDIKPSDLDRLMGYKAKPVFFARKFEAIISQEVLNTIDGLLGIDITDIPGFTYYWQNEFHHLDNRDKKSDVILTYSSSFIHRMQTVLQLARTDCAFTDTQILESHVLYIADNFHRYLVKYNVSLPGRRLPVTIETQLSMTSHYKIINPREGPIGRLQSLQVGTDFDVKELVFRNYPRFIGPNSDVSLRHVWGHGPAAVISVAWIDPAGVIADFQDITIAQESLIDNHKPKLQTPLRPGVWVVKILHKFRISAEVKFVVLPFSIYNNAPLTPEDAVKYHNGPEKGEYSVLADFNDLADKLGVTDAKSLYDMSVINGKKTGAELESWIDELTLMFWTITDSCVLTDLHTQCPTLDICTDTRWSSMSPDPKSEISKETVFP